MRHLLIIRGLLLFALGTALGFFCAELLHHNAQAQPTPRSVFRRPDGGHTTVYGPGTRDLLIHAGQTSPLVEAFERDGGAYFMYVAPPLVYYTDADSGLIIIYARLSDGGVLR